MSVAETLTRIDEALAGGLDLFEQLDFDPELDCEHQNHGKKPWHSGPAAHYIAARHPCHNCGRPVKNRLMLCARAWVQWGTDGVRCPGCDRTNVRDEYVQIVGSVK